MEVRYETVTELDTVFLELPVIVKRVATLDTSSHLENRYALSEASVSAGVLRHSLSTKPVRESVPVEVKTVYRDSVVYADKVIREDIYIEKPLNWWQKLRLRIGNIFLIAALVWILYKVITHFIHL